jgi:nitrous oxidase accessory protein NosD
MSKKLQSLTLCAFILTGIVLATSLLIFVPTQVAADTHQVNPGQSIQDAIDIASDGDTVLVSSGTYNENLTITKSIELAGASSADTIIMGTGLFTGIGVSQTESVDINTLTVRNFDLGISISQSSDVSLTDVIVMDCVSWGIFTDNTNDLNIEDCQLEGVGTGNGIETFQVSGLSFVNNTVGEFLNGVNVRFSDDPFVFGNTILSAYNNGIMLHELDGGMVENNHIVDVTASGVRVNRVDGAIIKDNTLYNVSMGFYSAWSEFSVRSISVDKCDYGVYFLDISNGKIYDSTISNSEIADFYVSLNKLTAVNTVFDFSKVIIAKQDAVLEVKNYLTIKVEGSEGDLIEGADVEIADDDETIYDSTNGDVKTDEGGIVGPIEVNYGTYEYDPLANHTLRTSVISANVNYNSFEVAALEGDPNDIDMSESRTEIFLYDNTPPRITDVSGKGNVSQSPNTLDRSSDESLAIFFWASETGQYKIIVDSFQDGLFNESNDTVLTGPISSGFQTIYWNGGNESGLFTDGIYPVKIVLIDVFLNVISEPYEEMTIRILNSDLDGDGHLDINDDLPSDPTQWNDNDNDGYGDNPSGSDADLFPQDPTQWFDEDGDGYGDNPMGNNHDMFPEEPSQWIDADGDGYGDNVSGVDGDAFPDDPTQWLDSDGDGYGDNQSGNRPDEFPTNILEWVDTDGDGYGDNNADAFPDDDAEWSDEDGDGMGDNSDFLPSINNWLLFFIIGIVVVILVAFSSIFRGQSRARKSFDPGVGAKAPSAATPQPKKAAPPVKKEEPAKARPPAKPKKVDKKPAPAPPKEEAEAPPPPPPPVDEEAPPPPPPQEGEEPPPPPPIEEETEKEDE